MKSEDGFTMIELTVVLIIGSLIAGISFSAYFFSEKSFYVWDKKACVTRLVDGAAQTIAADIRRAKSVTLISDSLAFLSQIDCKEILYHFEKEAITRNDVALNGDSSVTAAAGIAVSPYGYAINVGAVSRFKTAHLQVNVQQLESSASSFRASLFDADSN